MKKYLISALALCMLVAKSYADEAENCADFMSNFYVSGFGGFNKYQDNNAIFRPKFGCASAIAVGYCLPNLPLRIEAELAYKWNELDRKGFFKEDSFSTMLNGYLDFDLDSFLTPYVGFGMGYNASYYHFEVIRIPINADHFDIKAKKVAFSGERASSFAYQAILGVIAPINQHTYVGLECRYLGKMRHEFHEYSMGLTLKRFF